ncbi:MAG: endonuclease/exonuclease/phosphatase family protein [Planctomycetota bacterium]|nr:endonuclease/exonuclease/phosphatase family protein [Planctomycetota bacterium]
MKKLDWSNVVMLLAAPAAAAAVGAHTGFLHWSLDLIGCFAVQAMASLLLAATALALGRRWRAAAAAAAFAAVAAWAILPTRQRQEGSPQIVENSPVIQVASLNLLKSNHQGHLQALAVIRAADPDLLWLTEYTPEWQRFLRESLDQLPHRLERPDVGSFGAALYSRFPLNEAKMLPGGHLWAPYGRAVVQTPHGPVGVLGVHPPPPQPNHLAVQERDAGLAAIGPLLAALPARRIVLGDFNATPWNDAFVRMRRESGLSIGSTAAWLPSWPAPLPALLRIPIDHVLVGGDLLVTASRLGPAFGSDHLPLFADVQIPR